MPGPLGPLVTPGTPGTPSTRGTPGTPGTPGTLGTLGTLGTPGTPGTFGTPGCGFKSCDTAKFSESLCTSTLSSLSSKIFCMNSLAVRVCETCS